MRDLTLILFSQCADKSSENDSGVNASSKLGDEAPKSGRSLGANFLFCNLKLRILVNSAFCEFWGAKLKLFLYRELPQWGLGRFCGKS